MRTIQDILAGLFWSFLMICLGWWLATHPYKLIQYSGWFGDKFEEKVERTPVCPPEYICSPKE